jgi:hypothetical protein
MGEFPFQDINSEAGKNSSVFSRFAEGKRKDSHGGKTVLTDPAKSMAEIPDDSIEAPVSLVTSDIVQAVFEFEADPLSAGS